MALLSPGIQLFESSVTPPTAVTAAENGVATLSFSTRGPVNKLTRVRSISEFKEVFGDPVSDPAEYPYAHILAQSVLSNNTDLYFMRIADSTAKKASCPVVDYSITSAKVAIRDTLSTLTSGYFMAKWSWGGTGTKTEPTQNPYLQIGVTLPKTPLEVKYIYVPMNFSAKDFSPAGTGDASKNILWVSTTTVMNQLSSKLDSMFGFTVSAVTDALSTDSRVGILISAKDQKAYNTTDELLLTVTVKVGYIDNNNTFVEWTTTSEGDRVSDIPEVWDGTVTGKKEFCGKTLSRQSTYAAFDPTDEKYNWFNLTAKDPGSSMNDVEVVKTTVASAVSSSKNTWTVTVRDGSGVLEERTGITPDTFIEEMTKFTYIAIDDAKQGEGSQGEKLPWNWEDGTWVLGKGQLLDDGTYWAYETGDYAVVEGTDGFPTITTGEGTQYSESQAVELYYGALKSDEFVNTDEYSFSILATPGIQDITVQNAAIEVCATRGDAIYLSDLPYDLCQSKQQIDEIIDWVNGNPSFQTSYCAIYYGWFYQTNPYSTDNSIACPASCFIAPKMVALDQSMGEFYAPAGIARGGIICSDWSYSPDQKDRDKLVGNDNVINPISYSNTRGVTIMAQKTTDRTTSPLNRVGVRRMTNMIKRNLRSRLVALLFEPNNDVARARARTIVDDVLAGLRSKGCIETYNINVVSGTGANRNDLNVYLSFAPYGLIEKIYVYLSITDAGVEVTENVA